MRRIIFAAFFICIYSLPVTAQFQYIDENGSVKGPLSDVIKILNVDLSSYGNENNLAALLSPSHISFAHNFLKLFYQETRDFYRRGGTSSYPLTLEQSKQILQLVHGKCASFNMPDPLPKKKADVVICAGFERSLEKRFYSFQKFLEEGYQCDNIFFLSRTQELEDCGKQWVKNPEQALNGAAIHFIQAVYDKGSHEDFILKVKPFISDEFYVISDPEYALTLQESFTEYGKKHDLTCLGVFARAITTDPEEYAAQELRGYNYAEFILDTDNQVRAEAYSALNQLAHQVAQEMKLFELTQLAGE